MTLFYTVRFGRCKCGQPGTVEIFGPWNASYGVACEQCIEKRLRELEETHKDTVEFPKR